MFIEIIKLNNLIKGFLTFLDNSLVYLFNKTPSRGPLFVGWDITFNCNAKCSCCNTHKLNNGSDLTTVEALHIIKEMGEAKVWHLSLTGGEPLLRSDLNLLILAAKEHGMIVNINTNGSLLIKHAEMLVLSKVDSITISVDSSNSLTHDKYRGIRGLTENILKGIDKINSLKRGHKPAISIRMVVNKRNYKEVDKLIDKFKNKATVILQPIHNGIGISNNIQSGLLSVKDTDLFMFNKEDELEFKTNFKELLKKHKRLNTLYYKEFITFLFNKKLLWEKYRCFSGYFYLVINPYGDVFPCAALFNKLGNLRKESVMDVWSNLITNKWRIFVKHKQNQCICWCTNSIVNAYLSKIFMFGKLFQKDNPKL